MACHKRLVPTTVDACSVHGLACVMAESTAADRREIAALIEALPVLHAHAGGVCTGACPGAFKRQVLDVLRGLPEPLGLLPVRTPKCPKCGSPDPAVCAYCTTPL
jgi:hypothetical protein